MSKKIEVEVDSDSSYDDELITKINKLNKSKGINLNELDKGDKLIIKSFYLEKFGYKLKDEEGNYYYTNSQCRKFIENLLEFNKTLKDKEKIISVKENLYKLQKPLLILIQDKKEFNGNVYSVCEFHFMKSITKYKQV